MVFVGLICYGLIWTPTKLNLEMSRVGQSCRVFWRNDNEWFDGLVDDYHPSQGWHVQYYDGDDEWLQELDPTLVRFDDHFDPSDGKTTDNGSNESVRPPSSTPPASSSSFENLTSHERHQVDVSMQSPQSGLKFSTRDSSLDFSSDKIGSGELAKDDGFQQHDYAVNVATVLPERGVLLLGSVTGASNLSSPAASGESNGGVFFRVLFVEGGRAPAMFRCKTPIFTSDLSVDSDCFPSWSQGNFRFEIVAPRIDDIDTTGALTTSRTHSEQGSDTKGVTGARPVRPQKNKPSSDRSTLMHQTPRLAELSQDPSDEGPGGMIGTGNSSSNIPTLTGEVLIVVYRSRSNGGNDFLGQLSLDLGDITKTGVPESHSAGIECRSVRGSFPLTGRTGGNNSLGLAGLAHIDVSMELAWRVFTTTKEAVIPNARGVGSQSKAPSVNKAPSNPQSLVPNPEKRPPLNQSASSNASRRNQLEAYRIERENRNLAARLASHKSKHPTNHKSNQPPAGVYAIDAPPSISTEETAGITPAFARHLLRMGTDELQTLRHALVRESAQHEKTTKDLRATNTRLKQHVARLEGAIDKLRRTGALVAVSCVSGARVLMNPILVVESSSPPLPEDSENPRVSRLGTEAETTSDPELRELYLEHASLQELRRGLVCRIVGARMSVRQFVATIAEDKRRQELARLRIDGIDARLRGKDGKASDELLAIDRLRGVALELARTTDAQHTGIHLGPLSDSLIELRAVENMLSARIAELREDVETARYARDSTHARLTELSTSHLSSRLRSHISMLRVVLTRLLTRQRVARFAIGGDTIELEVLRQKLHKQQRLAGWD